MLSHIEDGDRELKKPVMFTEFGLSNLNKDYQPSQRDRFYKTIFDVIYKSAKKNRAGAGMEEYNDDFGIVPWERRSTYSLITEQSCNLARIRGLNQLKGYLKELCLEGH
ncbi:mannan endo-1 [Quercus suber]|uniref:mannan endo-1,4-beta-mannosidase n=1 Tax=Quercus suber TaxID=58331 RepID=A0AAW0L1H7_QUESU